MAEPDQIHAVCAFNRRLARENAGLRRDLRHLAVEYRKLARVNARLGVEAEASETFLATAIDVALEGGQG